MSSLLQEVFAQESPGGARGPALGEQQTVFSVQDLWGDFHAIGFSRCSLARPRKRPPLHLPLLRERIHAC